VTLFLWQNGGFIALTKYSMHDTVTSLAWSDGTLFAATTVGLNLLEPSGKVDEVARWRVRGAAALATLHDLSLCIVQGGGVTYYTAGATRQQGDWPLARASTPAVVHVVPPYILISSPWGVDVHVAVAEAAHGLVQHLSAEPATAERAAAATGSRRGRGRCPAAEPYLVAVWPSGMVAWAQKGGPLVRVGQRGSVVEQVSALVAAGLLREAMSVCESSAWEGQEAIADDLRVQLGVQFCNEVSALHCVMLLACSGSHQRRCLRPLPGSPASPATLPGDGGTC
jgi:hypothetical protein